MACTSPYQAPRVHNSTPVSYWSVTRRPCAPAIAGLALRPEGMNQDPDFHAVVRRRCTERMRDPVTLTSWSRKICEMKKGWFSRLGGSLSDFDLVRRLRIANRSSEIGRAKSSFHPAVELPRARRKHDEGPLLCAER
jgi:hypothetical protein